MYNTTTINFFQDIASDNAENYGFGYSYIYPKNLMWVLLKYRIEFETYPIEGPKTGDIIYKTTFENAMEELYRELTNDSNNSGI